MPSSSPKLGSKDLALSSAAAAAMTIIIPVSASGATFSPVMQPITVRGKIPAQIALKARGEGPESMADEALTAEVAKLTAQVTALAAAVVPPPPPAQWWRRVDGVGAVLAAAISIITLGSLFASAHGFDQRLGMLSSQLDKLDTRLTPAIDRLTAQIAALDKRLSVDEAQRTPPRPSSQTVP